MKVSRNEFLRVAAALAVGGLGPVACSGDEDGDLGSGGTGGDGSTATGGDGATTTGGDSAGMGGGGAVETGGSGSAIGTGGEGTGGEGTGGEGTGGIEATGGQGPTGGLGPTGGQSPTGGIGPTGGQSPTGGIGPAGGQNPAGGAALTGGAAPTGGAAGGTLTECDPMIGSNHGHVLVVSVADVELGQDKTYDIQGTSPHNHTVTLTAADFGVLSTGGTASVTSSNDAGHTHGVTVTCA